MEDQTNQPVHLEALDLTPNPAAIQEANRRLMQQYIRSLPPGELYRRVPEPPIRRKTSPNPGRWINIVNR